MSKRSQILEEIKTTLSNVSLLKSVEIERLDAINLTKQPLPCAFVYSGNDRRIDAGDNAVIGFENWDWDIFIEVWAKNQDLEPIVEEIHKKMYDNYKLNGLAEYSARYGSETFVVDPTRAVKGILLKYKVIFRHPLGRP